MFSYLLYTIFILPLQSSCSCLLFLPVLIIAFDASWVGNSADVPFPRVGWFSWNSTCGCLVKFSKHIVIVIIRHIVANTFNWRFNPCHVQYVCWGKVRIPVGEIPDDPGFLLVWGPHFATRPTLAACMAHLANELGHHFVEYQRIFFNDLKTSIFKLNTNEY